MMRRAMVGLLLLACVMGVLTAPTGCEFGRGGSGGWGVGLPGGSDAGPPGGGPGGPAVPVSGGVGTRPSAGPQAQLPDLVPSSADATGALCHLVKANDRLQVLVKVRNQGNADAVASVTTLQFQTPSVPKPILLPTPPIASGREMTLATVAVPDDCGGSECGATITVNATHTVKESNEKNNTVACTVRKS